jgi:5-methylcytosine-specific restriction enzyme subunit McrC
VGQFGPDRQKGDGLRRSLRRLVRLLDGISLIELTPDIMRRQQAERHDRDYRLMLAICDLVWQRRMPAEEAGQLYLSQLERDRLVLHRVYELFVANFYRYHLSNWRVSPQKSLVWHEKSPNLYLPTMKPDLLLQEKATGRIIVLDTKYTAKSLIENRWGKEIFTPAHLYQMHTYLSTQAHLSKRHQHAVGILLYPAVQGEWMERVALPRHEIYLACVNLGAAWPQIEQRLLDIIVEA